MGKSHSESGFFKSSTFSFHKKNKYKHSKQTPEEVFKDKFVDEFMDFKKDAEALSRGYVALSDGWKDISGYVGVTTLFTTGGAVVSGLALVGILSGVASFGIGFAVALVGIGAEVGYVIYRSKKKDKEFKRAADFFDDTEIDKDVHKVANELQKLYQNQLERCSLKDAEHLARSMVSALKYQILKDKHVEYDHLLDSAALQALILKANKKMKKDKIKLTTHGKANHNTKSLITRPAFYCAEDDKLYTCQKSRPEKYGVIYFETKENMDDYIAWAKKIKSHDNKWRYSPMISTEDQRLRERLSFFSHSTTSGSASASEALLDSSVSESEQSATTKMRHSA